MSRPDPKFTAAAPAALDAAEILAAFEAQLAGARGDRKQAIAELLAAAPGWKEARDSVGGAFAEGMPGLAQLPGISVAQYDAGVQALTAAYAHAFRVTWLATIGFGGASVLVALFSRSIDDKLSHDVVRRLGHGFVRDKSEGREQVVEKGGDGEGEGERVLGREEIPICHRPGETRVAPEPHRRGCAQAIGSVPRPPSGCVSRSLTCMGEHHLMFGTE